MGMSTGLTLLGQKYTPIPDPFTRVSRIRAKYPPPLLLNACPKDRRSLYLLAHPGWKAQSVRSRFPSWLLLKRASMLQFLAVCKEDKLGPLPFTPSMISISPPSGHWSPVDVQKAGQTPHPVGMRVALMI